MSAGGVQRRRAQRVDQVHVGPGTQQLGYDGLLRGTTHQEEDGMYINSRPKPEVVRVSRQGACAG